MNQTMNVIDVDLDEWDDNNDVFVEKQIKPINKLTVQQALLIKHNVLRTFESKSTSSTKTSKRRKTEKKENKNVCLEEKIQDFLSNENEVVHSTTINEVNNKVEFLSSAEEEKEVYCIKNTMQLCSHKKTNLIHHKRSTTPSKSVIVINQETNRLEVQKKQIITENVQLSPGIVKKKKKFSISEKVSPNLSLRSSPKKDFKKTFNSTFPSVPLPINDLKVTESTSFSCFSNFTDDSISGLSANETTSILESHFGNITQSTDEINFEDNGELLCLLLKKIILEVTKKQMNLKSVNLKNGKTIEKLLSDKECDILEEFCKLEGKICKVYVRMLCRTKQWHRVSKIYFKDVSADLYNVFEELHKKNFIDTNIEQENLQIQMEFLSRTEIQELCKLFRMPAKAYQSYKKTDLIKTLIKSNQSQTILTNMFSKKKDCLIDLLQAEVTKYLGTCIRINKAAKATFDKVILLFSFPHYFDEEDKRFRNQLYMCMNVHKQFINFPNYLVSQTIVFETREDFEKYSTALSIQESFHFAVISKDYKEFMSISEKVKEEFKNLLTNEEYNQRYMDLEPFLKRFSAGHIYAKLLTKFCDKFKTKNNDSEILAVAQMLLAQNVFLQSKRGKWYEILSKAYESMKNNKLAAETLIEALKDPNVNEVQKLNLQLRGQAILKKKTGAIEDVYLRESLDDACTILVQEPPSIEIRGKALTGNKIGYKSVYIEESNDEKLYTSVEERALLHYKTNGFPKGCHVEGFIIQSLYGLLFYDIIYGLSPPGVFQNSYQETPLDFYTEYFYLNRKAAIQLRLKEMCNWNIEAATNFLTSVYTKNFNTLCIVKWKEHFTSEMFCEIMQCITLPVLAKICKRLAKNYRVAQAGFPDLTLWNPEKKKCKFVEVKSPNDKLSPGQRIWLDFLRKIGLDCEVCNVKNISRKLKL